MTPDFSAQGTPVKIPSLGKTLGSRVAVLFWLCPFLSLLMPAMVSLLQQRHLMSSEGQRMQSEVRESVLVAASISQCYGPNCVPTKCYVEVLTPSTQTRTSLERHSLQVQLAKFRQAHPGKEWALIQGDWRPCKKTAM